ncbi:hypothetical protein V1477_016909 [Vespula maculifrons]|uniref:Uncharacterized protein n=1 Tax=Vespula maculifrons TaxID=7453 RepID=A0ABD2B4G3_VESMC
MRKIRKRKGNKKTMKNVKRRWQSSKAEKSTKDKSHTLEPDLQVGIVVTRTSDAVQTGMDQDMRGFYVSSSSRRHESRTIMRRTSLSRSR